MNPTARLGHRPGHAPRAGILTRCGGGATLVAGGTSIDRPGSYITPGILTGLAPDNPAYHEEFFGPMFLVFKARVEAEALALANDTEFGLGATIFSEDVGRAKRLARSIDAGMVFINHGAWTAPELPFGGVKSSGFGRELGELGIHEFVNKNLIRVQDATSSALREPIQEVGIYEQPAVANVAARR
jgi:succinate-semialdehyde dehydrogenase / glutarate-semialdehyde dehydrogenase